MLSFTLRVASIFVGLKFAVLPPDSPEYSLSLISCPLSSFKLYPLALIFKVFPSLGTKLVVGTPSYSMPTRLRVFSTLTFDTLISSVFFIFSSFTSTKEPFLNTTPVYSFFCPARKRIKIVSFKNPKSSLGPKSTSLPSEVSNFTPALRFCGNGLTLSLRSNFTLSSCGAAHLASTGLALNSAAETLGRTTPLVRSIVADRINVENFLKKFLILRFLSSFLIILLITYLYILL